MYEYIQGEITELTPTFLIIESGGIGYFINISINTYAQLSDNKVFVTGMDKPGFTHSAQGKTGKIYIHQVIREDAHILYGFINKKEREIFRLLITVSGIGANTARMILSSLLPSEIQQAIIQENVHLLKSIKGIGAKSAQRIIVDLKDKLGKEADVEEIFVSVNNTIKDESLSALVTLGFSKKSVEKVIDKILSESRNDGITVEELVKKALKKL